MPLPLLIPLQLFVNSLVLIVFITPCLFSVQSQQSVRFLITSDLHGWLSSTDLYPNRKQTGLLHLKDPIIELKQKDGELILLDAGDLLQGSPLTHYFHYVKRSPPGENPFFDLFNMLAFDAVAVGNHDLAINPEFESDYVPNSKFTWISCNIYRHGKPVFAPYLVKVQNGIRVAILGYTTPGTEMWLDPEQLNGIEFRSLEESISYWIPKLKRKEGFDLLVGLFHVGLSPYRDDENAKLNRIDATDNLRRILTETKAFDLVVSGHDHILDPRKNGARVQYVGYTPVISPGSYGEAAIFAKIHISNANGHWHRTGVEAEIVSAQQATQVTELYKRPVLVGYTKYLSESLPWEHTATSQETATKCINRLLALSNDEPSLAGTLFPALKIGGLKSSKGKNISRQHLFRWIKHDNKAVTVQLSERDHFLLTHPIATAGSLEPEYNRYLHSWLKHDIFAKPEYEFFLNKNQYVRKYRFKIADYHYWGGGGIIPALFLENNGVIFSSDFLRDKLFTLFKVSKSLPQECNFFHYRPLKNDKMPTSPAQN